MASGVLGGTLRHLRDLFHDGTAVGLGDGQLLARYAASRDEAAFEALVARHGPMVLATCRAVLEARARRRGRVPGHLPGAGAEGALGPRRRRPGRLAAPRRLSRRRAGRRRVAAEAPPRGGGSGDDDTPASPHRPRARRRVDHARGGRPAARPPAAAGGPLRPGGPDLRAGRRPPALDRADAAASAGQGPAAAARPADPPGRHGGCARGRAGRVGGRGEGGGAGRSGALGGRGGDGRGGVDHRRRPVGRHHQGPAHDQAEDHRDGRRWPRRARVGRGRGRRGAVGPIRPAPR